MLKPCKLVACVLVALLYASTVSAQTDGRFAVGMNGSLKGGPDEGAIGGTNLGFLWRFGHGGDGWGWHYGLGWYGLDLLQPVNAQRESFGVLRIRPIMGGYGYSRRFGRTALTAKVMSGYAFNSFKLQESFDDAYRRDRGVTALAAKVSNGLVVKPEISAWIDLSRKIGVNISAGYMVARPDVTVRSSLGVDKRSINADAFMLKIGAVYSVF